MNEYGAQVAGPGFHVLYLPYREDFRHFKPPKHSLGTYFLVLVSLMKQTDVSERYHQSLCESSSCYLALDCNKPGHLYGTFFSAIYSLKQCFFIITCLIELLIS